MDDSEFLGWSGCPRPLACIMTGLKDLSKQLSYISYIILSFISLLVDLCL